MQVAVFIRMLCKDSLPFWRRHNAGKAFTTVFDTMPRDNPGNVGLTVSGYRRIAAADLWLNAAVNPKIENIQVVFQPRYRWLYCPRPVGLEGRCFKGVVAYFYDGV